MQYVHNAQEMKSLLSKPPYLKRVHYQFRRGQHFWIFIGKDANHVLNLGKRQEIPQSQIVIWNELHKPWSTVT